jgi:predicted RNase H-like HicB family nuclease
MATSTTIRNGSVQHWVVARPEPSGQFTAQVVGLPELAATAATREEAIEQVRALLLDWVATGRLVSVEVPVTNPLLGFTGFLDPNDPIEKQFVEDLARFRQEDLERTLREYDEECSSSSSTPTT